MLRIFERQAIWGCLTAGLTAGLGCFTFGYLAYDSGHSRWAVLLFSLGGILCLVAGAALTLPVVEWWVGRKRPTSHVPSNRDALIGAIKEFQRRARARVEDTRTAFGRGMLESDQTIHPAFLQAAHDLEIQERIAGSHFIGPLRRYRWLLEMEVGGAIQATPTRPREYYDRVEHSIFIETEKVLADMESGALYQPNPSTMRQGDNHRTLNDATISSSHGPT